MNRRFVRSASFRSGRRQIAWALGALASIAAGAMSAAAGEPAAIVEDVADGVAQLAFMDYVEAGRVIDLGRDRRIVLGYLRSCLRETVVGGRLTVGHEQSSIAGGHVDRVRVECDGGRMVMSASEAGKSTVMVLRQAPPGGPAVQPSLRIYSLSPAVRIGNGAKTLVIERLDLPAPLVTIRLRGAADDLRRTRTVLMAGALYRATAGDRQVIFDVDALATRSDGPLVGRLIQF